MSYVRTPVEELTRMRLARAWTLRALRSSRKYGPARCADLLENPPECVRSMDVHELLEECAGIGPRVADRMQTIVGLFKAVRVDELSYAKRCALVALLRYRHPSDWRSTA